jgi:molecular chaperone DnaK (HSP70)
MALTKLVNGVRMPLNEQEIKEFEEREALFKKRQQEAKKTEYLRKRKLDPDMPSIEDKINAIYEKLANNNNSQLESIKKKIEEIKIKHPKPDNE